jgi:hypothetical protein
MRALDGRLLTPTLGGACAVLFACAAPHSAESWGDAQRSSFVAMSLDSGGHFIGGTEVRLLTGHAGKLYGANGYWEDWPGLEGPHGARILVLDQSGARWRVDHSFDERMPSGRPRDLAISALREVGFETDGKGARLPSPVSLLIASAWDLTGTTRVFTRDDTTGAWTATTLAQDRPLPDFAPQVRSFGAHRDGRTGIDLVFAGQSPRGIFSGVYDALVPGRVRWGAAPELDISRISTSAFSGLAGRVRVSSFAECRGRLYAAVGQQIYERIDGVAPDWRAVYTNPHPHHSETGLRGLTAIPGASGNRDVLLAAVEGDDARIIRVDPNDGSEVTELDLGAFLSNQWQARATYVIAAYNDMTKVHDAQHGDLLLIGLEAFLAARGPVPSGHRLVDVGYGRLDAGAWYLIRYPDTRYELREINAASTTGQALVATRSIAPSPFPGEAGTLYFAGYDANKAPAHNTGWIFRASPGAALGAPQK